MVTDRPQELKRTFTESELLGEVVTHRPLTTTADFIHAEQTVTLLPLSPPPSATEDITDLMWDQHEHENITSATMSPTGT